MDEAVYEHSGVIKRRGRGWGFDGAVLRVQSLRTAFLAVGGKRKQDTSLLTRWTQPSRLSKASPYFLFFFLLHLANIHLSPGVGMGKKTSGIVRMVLCAMCI